MKRFAVGDPVFRVENYGELRQGSVAECPPGHQFVVGRVFGGRPAVLSDSVESWHPSPAAAVNAELVRVEQDAALARERVIAMLGVSP